MISEEDILETSQIHLHILLAYSAHSVELLDSASLFCDCAGSNKQFAFGMFLNKLGIC
jgi:hypothetical protein